MSDAPDTNLAAQVVDAVSFLRSHDAEIRRLIQFPGVEGVTLDFGIARRDVAAQFDYLPPELIQLAGSLALGIELSQYQTAGVENDAEPT